MNKLSFYEYFYNQCGDIVTENGYNIIITGINVLVKDMIIDECPYPVEIVSWDKSIGKLILKEKY